MDIRAGGTIIRRDKSWRLNGIKRGVTATTGRNRGGDKSRRRLVNGFSVGSSLG